MICTRAALAGAMAGLVLLAPIPGAAQQLPSMDQVVDHLDDLYRSKSSHAILTMTVVRERGTRELTMESWSKGDDDALIVIRSPAREAGTATLMTEEGLWNYAPRADRLIRIPTGLLSESWMGSHFTNDDLMRETSYTDDYETELSWAERDDQRYLQVTLTPKPEAPVVYTQVLFFLTPDSWTPVREEFYDQGDLVRYMTFDQVQDIGGRSIPMRMVLQPTDAPDEHTTVKYDELHFDVQVDASMFTRRGLRRVAG
jgi:outer membrane lipoprotein-sorting protein